MEELEGGSDSERAPDGEAFRPLIYEEECEESREGKTDFLGGLGDKKFPGAAWGAGVREVVTESVD